MSRPDHVNWFAHANEAAKPGEECLAIVDLDETLIFTRSTRPAAAKFSQLISIDNFRAHIDPIAFKQLSDFQNRGHKIVVVTTGSYHYKKIQSLFALFNITLSENDYHNREKLGTTYLYNKAGYIDSKPEFQDGMLFDDLIANKPKTCLFSHIKENASFPNLSEAYLFYVIQNDDSEVLNILKKYPAEINRLNSNNLTPIQVVAESGSWSFVTTIGCTVKTDDVDTARYGSALEYAAQDNQTEVVITLLDANSSVGDYSTGGNFAIHHAAHHQNEKMLRAILLKYPDEIKRLDQANKTTIQIVSALNYWTCVTAVACTVKTDAKDTAKYGSALERAARSNKTEIVTTLLEANSSVCSHCCKITGYFAIHQSVHHRNEKMLRAILQKYPNEIKRANTITNQTPIQFSAQLHYWNFVIVIAGIVNTDTTDIAKYAYALLMAACFNQTDAVIALLNANAPAHFYDEKTKDNVMHYAVHHKNVTMFRALNDKHPELASIENLKGEKPNISIFL